VGSQLAADLPARTCGPCRRTDLVITAMAPWLHSAPIETRSVSESRPSAGPQIPDGARILARPDDGGEQRCSTLAADVNPVASAPSNPPSQRAVIASSQMTGHSIGAVDESVSNKP